MSAALPLRAGMIFGDWTLIELLAERTKGGQRQWLCVCICGVRRPVVQGNFVRGLSKNCGCRLPQRLRERNFRHGMTTDPAYKSWEHMWQRCTNEKNKNYADYGGRGITVAAEWRDFKQFRHDVGARPEPKLTLERVDNNGHYAPGNVIWATRKAQAINRRVTRFITFANKTQTLSAWAEEKGMTISTLFQRLAKWSVEEALQRPVRKMKKREYDVHHSTL